MEQDTAQGEDLEQRIDAASQSEETEEPTPSSEEAEPQEDAQEVQADPQDVTEEEALANAKNPERTKAYIDKLKEQARANQPQENIFDQFRTPEVPSAQNFDNLDQAQVNDIASNYVDEDGNVDIQRLNQALDQANHTAASYAQQAQQAAQQVTRYEESRQLQEAYQSYPQLDPESNKFDPNFYDMVSSKIMVENYAKGGALTVKQAADNIAQFYSRPNEEKTKKQAVKEYKESQENRQQGPIEAGKGADRVETSDSEDLRNRTRQGDDIATAERLKNLGI